MADKKCIIDVAKDGPLLVKNISNFKNSKGEGIETKEVMALCRCGASSSKPFCDGTHGKIGFSGKLEKGRSKDKRSEFKGKGISILDNPGVCAHAGFCDGNLKDVFWEHKDGKRIAHPDKASKGDIIRVVNMCPSGSLSYAVGGKVYDKQNREPRIIVSKDGPYDVVGSPELKDDIGTKPDSKEHYTLCRCGVSKNKPFCDGMHRHIKFKDNEN
jgi:CDGSH-type Zn-finger protein/ferredoxin